MKPPVENLPHRRFPARRILRWLGWGAAIAVPGFAVLVVTVGYAFSGPHYDGPPSDHFDGSTFHNVPEVPRAGFWDFLKWRVTRETTPWNVRALPPGPPPPREIPRGELRVTYINHATTLVQMDAVNILTDPIWSDRTSPVSFAGPQRHHPPGLRFEDLPPIHAVVVSHNHYDHMDLPTLKRLHAAHAPRFFVGLGNSALLGGEGIDRVTELDWWQSEVLTPDVRIHGVPAQHFSNRGLFDRNATLWLGYVIQGPEGHVVFAGDTGFGPHFSEIRRKFGPARLAILPIGAFKPRWFMGAIHQTPEESLLALAALGANTALAIHFGTFPLADDTQDEPTQTLESALSRIDGVGSQQRPRFWALP
ncbi:MAG: MBL fold metallo-hydrolase, partial [Deltaproteobacteria bacterium]|nr:MBL fold metallo-hydrolase [Deltaproteobacteria bacterium]